MKSPLLGIVAVSSALMAMLGCGGSGSDDSPSVPQTYAGFGYTDVLYRGTLTAANGSGQTLTGPIAATLRPKGAPISSGPPLVAYGLTAANPTDFSTFQSYRLLVTGDVTILNAPFSGLSEYRGTAKIVERSRTLRTTFADPGYGATATLNATIDDPDLTPAKPPAGAYEGMNFGRLSLSGSLQYAGPARGRVEADGTFAFTYVATGYGSSGELRGKIADDGTVSDVVLIRDDTVGQLSDQTVRAYGTAGDLTVVIRSTSGEQIGDNYRLVRTGD